MESPRLSLTEWAVLTALTERPAHPFAVARLLAEDGELGRVLTVRRPLVYRAFARLEATGLCRADHTEPGEGGPERTVYRATTRGRRLIAKWLSQPVTRTRGGPAPSVPTASLTPSVALTNWICCSITRLP